MKNFELHWYDSVYSDGSPLFVHPQNPALGAEIEVRLRVFAENPIRQVFVRIAPDGEKIFLPMRIERKDAVFTWWRGKFQVSAPLMTYRFLIQTDEHLFWYNAEGWTEFTPADDADFRILADYAPPPWLPDRVFYQIFPDSFRDGDPATNVRDNEYEYLGQPTHAMTWGTPPRTYRHARSVDFYGGDLAGIRHSLNHLKQLGVNALYLNPIFHAPSNHKYDTQDYFTIDPHFGTNAEFAELVGELHRADLRILLDGVFNHSGVKNAWFQEAQQQPDSQCAEFFIFAQHPDKYHCWNGVKTLATLNYRSTALRDIIYAGEHSVIQTWLKPPYQIDGWRFDVANMLGRQGATQIYAEVWREIRQCARHANADAYLMGEHSFDPTALLQGDMLDGAMNYYGFTTPARQWLTGHTTFSDYQNQLNTVNFDRQVRHFHSRISWQIALNQFNFINCHDLPRLSAIARDERQIRLAAVLLLTFLGIPSIYYGDEIGLPTAGKDVEFSRQCMEWDATKWNADMWELYRALIHLRKQSSALQIGSLQTVCADGGVYAYARFTARQLFLIVLNNGEEREHVWLPVKVIGLQAGQQMRDVLTDQAYTIDAEGLCLPKCEAYRGMLLKKEMQT